VLQRFRSQLDAFVVSFYWNYAGMQQSFFLRKPHDLDTFKKYLQLRLQMVILFIIALIIIYIYLIHNVY